MNTENIKSNFQFLGNTIADLTLHNEFIALPTQELSGSFDVQYDIIDIQRSEKEMFGSINLYVACELEESEVEEPRKYKISLTVNGAFTDDKDINEEDFKKLLSVNGCASLYSIARSIITSITSQSVVSGSVILPMINVFKMVEQPNK